MLYPKNKDPELNRKLFAKPTAEYRGTPFWAWNCELDKSALLEQIEVLKEMGMGGFHIHSRTGMATEYLSDAFMDLVKACQVKAKNEELLCWLYDEDRWPSGAAGGLVTKDVEFRARHLLFTPRKKEGFEADRPAFERKAEQSKREKSAVPKGYFLAAYSVVLKDGLLDSYARLSGKDSGPAEAAGNVWYLYLELNAESPWFNNQTYVDTLNPKAIKRFADISYQRYYDVLGDEFGKSVPAIFTDEPQFVFKQALAFAEEKRDLVLPFTDDFPETYRKAFSADFFASFPEIFWELPGGEVSATRYRYHQHSGELFAQAFCDTLGDWCSEHGIAFTGHMMKEPTLLAQTVAIGEAMRSYRGFHIPGIDMLCDYHEFTTAKQCQSAVHQYGREGMLSELYGVTNWDFDFRRHKLQGDWQAALGVTVRVPHLSLVSMGGEAKRDYPASINYQAPWYKEYPLIEDHFARLNTALTRGKPQVRIGVIHPIESYWLSWGPGDQTSQRRDEQDRRFQELIEWMIFGLVDFDYISEALFPGQTPASAAAPLKVGEMAYDVVIVPACATLRATTLERLERFRASGGKLIFMGDVATHVDAAPSDRAFKLAEKSERIPFTRLDLLRAVEDERLIDIRFIESTRPDDHLQKFMRKDGSRTEDLIHQVRRDGEHLWLFICHAYPKVNDHEYPRRLIVGVKGKFKVELFDTLRGGSSAVATYYRDGKTNFVYDAYAQDSLLLMLTPTGESLPASAELPPVDRVLKTELLEEPYAFELSEPNVLLLDTAEYAMDREPWQPNEEILRIDLAVRRKLGWAPRSSKGIPQPWVYKDTSKPEHTVRLRYTIRSEIDIADLKLAVELPMAGAMTFNGKALAANADGWYVDKAISTVPLPPVKKGENTLVLEVPFGKPTNLESLYLLGDFGVRTEGRYATIVPAPKKLVFGDLVRQGLPFYSANVSYRCRFSQQETGPVGLELSRYGGAAAAVELDGKRVGHIAFAPNRIDLGTVSAGAHELKITVFGNRLNTLGQVHLTNSDYYYFGPDSWRTTGSNWSYPYQLKPSGILSHPFLFR